MNISYSVIFSFLFISNAFYTQDRIHVAETNIDFSRLPDVVIQKKDSLPYSGLVYSKYKNGNIQYEWAYENGVPNGLWKYYFYTGKIQYEFTYVDGDKNGPCRAWYFNGALNFESQYKNDQLDGEQIFWTYSGEFDAKRTYANGQCIKGCEN
tara:strand:- start:10324 stop:10779 length:456 start_codon:yes stop_codon:yes gene_type:complete